MNNREVGKIFELYAINYLKSKGYIILNHQFRCKVGEIDIVCQRDSIIVFVEVKYRKNIKSGYPREAVNYKKQNKIRKVAQYYILKNSITDKDFRFDVIEIIGENELLHLENAF